MAIEDFSSGYYKTEMSVQPYSDGPAIEQGLYDFIKRKFYYNTDTPVTPSPEAGIPTNVIGLTMGNIERSGVHPSDDNVSVFVLKPEFAYMFNNAERLGKRFIDSSNLSDTTLEKEDRRFFDLEGDR